MPMLVKNLKTGRYNTDFELDPQELAAIGRVTVQWAYLEHGVFATSYQLCAEAKATAPPEISSANFKVRLRAFLEIIRELAPKEDRARLLKIHSQIANIEHDRHKLTHGMWDWDAKDPNVIVASSFRPRFEFSEVFDCEKLYALGTKIGEISAALEHPEGFASLWASHADQDGQVTYGGISRLGLRMLTGTLPEDHPLYPLAKPEG